MKPSLFTPCRFIASCATAKEFPTFRGSRGTSLPEVAFVGRSNVGKSSLLNDLCGKKIAKISATPGKTQLVNFFLVEELCVLVDLPGYGYARVPEALKKNWGDLIQGYLEARSPLALIVFLLDVRHLPTEEDLQFLHWAHHYKKPVIIVCTKSDKIPKSAAALHTKKIVQAMPYNGLECIHYSIKTHQGKDRLRHSIQTALGLYAHRE